MQGLSSSSHDKHLSLFDTQICILLSVKSQQEPKKKRKNDPEDHFTYTKNSHELVSRIRRKLLG